MGHFEIYNDKRLFFPQMAQITQMFIDLSANVSEIRGKLQNDPYQKNQKVAFVRSFNKKRKHQVLFHISACAFILTNPMLSGVTFLF